MNAKKLFLSLTLAALAAGVLIGPASASAAMFNDNGEPIGEGSAEVEYEGPWEWSDEGLGVACETAHLSVAFTTEDARIEAFESTGCSTTGLFASFGCEVVADPTGDELPWTVDPLSSSKVAITNLKIVAPVNAGCPFADENGDITFTGQLRGTSGEPGSADTFALGGRLVSPTMGEVEISGDWTSLSPATIGIE